MDVWIGGRGMDGWDQDRRCSDRSTDKVEMKGVPQGDFY